jgi:predicted DNA repair protein MutK
LVACIVKLDDGGLYLSQRAGDGVGVRLQRQLGQGILKAAPYLMKTLSVVGTAAMFLVGGGILTHGVPAAHGLIEHWSQGAGAILQAPLALALDAAAGILAGAAVLAAVTAVKRLRQRFS